MKVFVAGATGVIGRSLLPQLVELGHEVAGTTIDPDKAALVERLGARPVVIDVFDHEALIAAVRAHQPDVMIHELTSLRTGDFGTTNRLRITGTRNLVDAARAAEVPRLLAQGYCLYAPGTGLADEHVPFAGDSPELAGMAQVLGTLEAMVSEVPIGVVLRYGNLYGPGTSFDVDGDFAAEVRQSRVPLNDNVVSFVHVDDAARATVLALDWPAGPVNVVDDEPAAGTTWLPVYAAALGAPPPPALTGTGAEYRGPRAEAGIGRRGASNAMARSLGWVPRYPTWRTGLGRVHR